MFAIGKAKNNFNLMNNRRIKFKKVLRLLVLRQVYNFAKNKAMAPTREQIANFLLSRPHISVASLEKEIKTYQGQIQKAINGKLDLKPATCAKIGNVLAQYGFTWTEKKGRQPSPRAEKKQETKDPETPPAQKKRVIRLR